MRKIEELIKNVKDDMAYYGKTIDMRSMNDIPVNGMPEKYKECERLLEILEAERDGRLVVLPCKVGDTVYQLRPKRYAHGNMLELKRCPFCGGELSDAEKKQKWRIYCCACGASTDWYSSYLDAESAWNRRVEPNGARPEVDLSEVSMLDLVNELKRRLEEQSDER